MFHLIIRRGILFFVMTLIFCLSGKAQTKEISEKNLSFLKNKISLKTTNKQYDKKFASSGEPQIILSWMYLVYKNTLSSQDGDQCVYYPSCSTYSIRVIQSKGPLIGLMATFDRLTRCHPMAAKYHPVHTKTKRLYDPVDKNEYILEKEHLQYLPDYLFN